MNTSNSFYCSYLYFGQYILDYIIGTNSQFCAKNAFYTNFLDCADNFCLLAMLTLCSILLPPYYSHSLCLKLHRHNWLNLASYY